MAAAAQELAAAAAAQGLATAAAAQGRATPGRRCRNWRRRRALAAAQALGPAVATCMCIAQGAAQATLRRCSKM
ncbi:hypothetical protein CHLRE_12g495952v5 [Chlamydomonas reinhardtii]|uniref:Uncharacterized protein n=1 Tax=Chlamydomonas reinhardtii TaxID=3055 RepID=A0A2K3D217_CHLRE|nr:uncharacterized protein CHLRE_12g495952v5 [Chlamydomonas reinhardtii]PNW74574.1 hypothetical protein CHLRE_12g495952v5 [Chlamydomonas reinhardtii]